MQHAYVMFGMVLLYFKQKYWHIHYLLRSTLAASMPVALAVNVGNSCAFVHRIEGQEMHLSDSCSCLKCHKMTKLNEFSYFMLSVKHMTKIHKRMLKLQKKRISIPPWGHPTSQRLKHQWRLGFRP